MEYQLPCVVRVRSSQGHGENNRAEVAYSMSGILIEQKQGLVISHGSSICPILKSHPEIAQNLKMKGFSPTESKNILVDVLLQTERNISNKPFSYQTAINVPTKKFYTKLLNCGLNDVENLDSAQKFQGKVLFVFKSRKFQQSLENLLPVDSGWKFQDEPKADEDSTKIFDVDQSMDLLMSCFVLIGLESWSSDGIVPVSMATVPATECHVGDPVEIIATPFGDLSPEVFMNSHSRGVLSNLSGADKVLILTDARCIPGSEGGPVYILDNNSNRHLLGMVVSPLCWKNNEWIGLAIICEMREIIKQLNRILTTLYPSLVSISVTNKQQGSVKRETSCLTEGRSVCLVRSGSTWGSGVLVNSHLGIILTCSHVVRWGVNPAVLVKFSQSSKWYRAHIVHCTPEGDQFDIAVLIISHLPDGFVSSTISSQPIKQGDAVRVIGHALFDEDMDLPPSITTGVISKIKNVNKTPVLIQTTCAVHAGASGGAVIDSRGQLVGMVVCNAKDVSSGASFPYINLSVPLQTISPVLREYEISKDQNVLKALHIRNKQVKTLWNLGNTESKVEQDKSKRVESKL